MDDIVDTLSRHALGVLKRRRDGALDAKPTVQTVEAEKNAATVLGRLLGICARLRHDLMRRYASLCFWAEASHVYEALFSSHRNVLLHGSAGSGKVLSPRRGPATRLSHRSRTQSTLSNALYSFARQQLPDTGSVLMLAPTQAAAELLDDGGTIHAFLGLTRTIALADLVSMHDMYVQSNRSKFARIFGRRKGRRFPSLIVFDEVSMIGVRLLECIDYIMRHRADALDAAEPFGGCRVVFVGDFCQLPPVCDTYAFKWSVWSGLDLYRVALTRSLRQDGDRQWYDYLQRIRRGEMAYIRGDAMTPTEISLERYEEIMAAGGDAASKPLVLSADNAVVEALNAREFARIAAPVERTYDATDILVKQTRLPTGMVMWTRVAGQQPTPADKQKMQNVWRLQTQVELKVGARYVITFNICKSQGIYNGQACVYRGVEVGGMTGTPVFELMGNKKHAGKLVGASGLVAKMVVSTQRLESVYIQREQIALRLGYAQTIHRSQGMTLENCLVDLRTLRCAGQFYVAMSRVRRRADVCIMCPTTARIKHSSEVLYYLRSNDLLEGGGAIEEDGSNDPFAADYGDSDSDSDDDGGEAGDEVRDDEMIE